jgi:glycosyltransferase involved in cell wall biosynthesis
MKRANPNLRWIADYRDPWHDNMGIPMTPKQRLEQKALELQTIQSADELTTVSTELADQLAHFAKRPVRVIENGFDADEEEVASRLRSVRTPLGGSARIVYTGMVYPNLQDVEPLLAVLARMRSEGRVEEGVLLCEFYGSRVDAVRRLAALPKYKGLARFHGHVSRETSLQVQLEADLLLLLETPKAGVVPAKLFEYMASGRPILSIGPDERSATADILSVTGTGRSVGMDNRAIMSAVEDVLRGSNPRWFAPDIDAVLRYSRKSRAQAMYEIVGGGSHAKPASDKED